jgi:hypothetical protein
MPGQGRTLDDLQVKNIVRLLSSTDMTISELAQRFGCSRSAIASINRKYLVRLYNGKRTQWEIRSAAENTLQSAEKAVVSV